MKRASSGVFEIMNMNDKTFIFSDAPSGFFQNFFSGIFRFFFSGKIFRQNFFKNFSAEFFPQNFQRKIFFKNFSAEFFQRNIFSTSLSGIQELNLSGYPFHLTKAFFFFWSRRITFSIRKIF